MADLTLNEYKYFPQKEIIKNLNKEKEKIFGVVHAQIEIMPANKRNFTKIFSGIMINRIFFIC